MQSLGQGVGLLRHFNPALPPGPQTGHRGKQQAPVDALLPINHQPLARPQFDVGFAQPETPFQIITARIAAAVMTVPVPARQKQTAA